MSTVTMVWHWYSMFVPKKFILKYPRGGEVAFSFFSFLKIGDKWREKEKRKDGI